jgi:ADP-heptose:LPS heptosyltransferase
VPPARGERAARRPADLGLAVPAVEPAVRGAVVVHPGAAQVSRHWPAERWAAVARALAAGARPSW